jgi:hypothetical protein
MYACCWNKCCSSCHTWLLSLLITEGHHWVPSLCHTHPTLTLICWMYLYRLQIIKEYYLKKNCEPIVWRMWQPRRFGTLFDSTAWYWGSFNFANSIFPDICYKSKPRTFNSRISISDPNHVGLLALLYSLSFLGEFLSLHYGAYSDCWWRNGLEQ